MVLWGCYVVVMLVFDLIEWVGWWVDLFVVLLCVWFSVGLWGVFWLVLMFVALLFGSSSLCVVFGAVVGF